MEVVINARNLEMTETLRDYVEKRLDKLNRFLSTIDEARLDLVVQNTKSAQDSQVAQLTIRSRGSILRVEERTGDMLASVDMVTDKMAQRITRFKGKHYGRGRGPVKEIPAEEFVEEQQIVRRKRFEMQTMDEEEAIEQMELLGHDFFVFYSSDDDAVNVIYRRRDGNYGLLQPTLD